MFNDLFLESHATVLQGNATEPLYTPRQGQAPAQLCFRADYASSALHEIAHWCIAGPSRRERVDYGYWYDADGRSCEAQARFLTAEARPQALEWCLSQASLIRFRLSLDNLNAPLDSAGSRAFAGAVVLEAQRFVQVGLPARAAVIFEALGVSSGARLTAAELEFSPVDIL